jgi:hypothetical protein
MNSLTILQALLEDASESTGANVTRDLITIKSRLEHEGESFLSICLPTFGKLLLAGLDSGVLPSTVFHYFRRKTKSGGKLAVPCFLHGLVSKVFDERTGNLRENACVVSINFLWKICNLYKKEKKPCSKEREQNAFHAYVDTDLSLRKRKLPEPVSLGLVRRRVVGEIRSRYAQPPCLRVAGYGNAYGLSDSTGALVALFGDNYQTDSRPRHGPGATADGLKGNQKYTSRLWYSRWNGVFSWEDLYGFSTVFQADSASLSTDHEIPVKVISVPKTQKTPRIISVEPTGVQYAQQLVSSRLISAMSTSSFRRQIDIRNQKTNANLALSGSLTGEWATIDLSEASDRVSAKLVRDTFRSAPQVSRELFATRSRHAQLPDGTLLTLAKFASMGSACTFPVETLVFYTLAVSAIVDWRWESVVAREGDPAGLNCRDMHSICETSLGLAFAYGDDIIVPNGSFSHVVSRLEDSNLKVNRDKSFSQGAFRESCGMDAYEGYEITPVYVRTAIPTTIRDASEFVSWVAFANNAYKHGLWRLSNHVRQYIDRLSGFALPHVRETSPGLGWFSFLGSYEVHAYEKSQMRYLVRTWKKSMARKSSQISGYDALLKFFITKEGEGCVTDSDHLSFDIIRNSMSIRRRMVQPF